MKKRIFLFLIISFFLVGCGPKKKEKPKTKPKETYKEPEPEVTEPTYVDENQIIVGLYDRNGTTLKLQKEYNGPINIKKDITTFQVFFSNEEEIRYSNMKFGEYYLNKFNEVNPEHKYKVGFNLRYTLNDGTEISQNIFGPSTTQTNYDYIEVYLYDSYKHRNDSFYSHIEENEFNDETNITSIKLTAGSKFNDISSRVTLTVFTYDDDDFEENTNEYRGNSKYSVTISNINKNYEE